MRLWPLLQATSGARTLPTCFACIKNTVALRPAVPAAAVLVRWLSSSHDKRDRALSTLMTRQTVTDQPRIALLAEIRNEPGELCLTCVIFLCSDCLMRAHGSLHCVCAGRRVCAGFVCVETHLDLLFARELCCRISVSWTTESKTHMISSRSVVQDAKAF